MIVCHDAATIGARLIRQEPRIYVHAISRSFAHVGQEMEVITGGIRILAARPRVEQRARYFEVQVRRCCCSMVVDARLVTCAE